MSQKFFKKMMSKIKILITGGTGYIGSHTAVELIENGFEVVIIDNLANSSIEVLDKIKQITGVYPIFEKVDIQDQLKLEDFFKKHSDLAGIIHFAASKSVNESVENPLYYHLNNVLGLINVLKEAKRNNIKNFIFSSSCTVYGQPDQLPVTEKTPLLPAMSPYGNTKKIGESILQDIACPDLNVVALRYFNPVGAHASTLIGELPNGTPNNLMPFITQTAIGIREKLLVFGNDYNTSDGTAIRDYIHVVDLAKAHVKALQRLLNNENKAPFETFNVGTGKGYSVLEIIKSFEKISGKVLNWEFAPRRSGDIEKIWADVELSSKELKWESHHTLDQMTESAWEWEKKLNHTKK